MKNKHYICRGYKVNGEYTIVDIFIELDLKTYEWDTKLECQVGSEPISQTFTLKKFKNKLMENLVRSQPK